MAAMAEGQRIAIIVAGGSRGIGEAISRRLHDDGYTVAVLDLLAPDYLITYING